VMAVRNPHFQIFLQKNSPQLQVRKFVRYTSQLLNRNRPAKGQKPPECSGARVIQTSVVGKICETLQGGDDKFWKKCDVLVGRIKDDDMHFIQGSSPVCPLACMSSGAKYLWLPITKKIAVCIVLNDNPRRQADIIHVAMKKSLVDCINKFIYDTSSEILVQSHEHLKLIQELPETRIHFDPNWSSLLFVRFD